MDSSNYRKIENDVRHIISADRACALTDLVGDRLVPFDLDWRDRQRDGGLLLVVSDLAACLPNSVGKVEQRLAVALDTLVGGRGDLVRSCIADLLGMMAAPAAIPFADRSQILVTRRTGRGRSA